METLRTFTFGHLSPTNGLREAPQPHRERGKQTAGQTKGKPKNGSKRPSVANRRQRKTAIHRAGLRYKKRYKPLLQIAVSATLQIIDL